MLNTTEIFNRDSPNDRIIRHDIDQSLNHWETVIPLDSAVPWLAHDLDLDGQVDLVSQWGDELKINSAPDWTQRAYFRWPGYNVIMNPTLVELDGDPYPEIFLTPNTLGLTGRIVVIDYDPVEDTFVKIVDYIAAEGAYGQPAVGDFDDDGRVEIIAGAELLGYHLYEWQESTLVDIGFVGDTNLNGGNESAVSCRPKPGDTLHALLGHSRSTKGYWYTLLKPTGDNTFETVHTFAALPGFHGAHPCQAADTDCDGLDEIIMNFYPSLEVWGWDQMSEDFVMGCVWNQQQIGTLIPLYYADLDQNGAYEWAASTELHDFFAFPDPQCVACDSSGQCPIDPCYCYCFGDPADCQGLVDVFDVVSSVDEAFRSGPPIVDPSWLCPYTDNDVTCNNVVDVFDVVAIVDVAFRSADPAVAFCNPCAP